MSSDFDWQVLPGASDADRVYKWLYMLVRERGLMKSNRTDTNTLSVFGVSYKIRVSSLMLPLVTYKRMYWSSICAELCWYLSGQPNIKQLQEQTRIWDSWSDELGRLEFAYPRFWRHYPIANAEDLMSGSVHNELGERLPGLSSPFVHLFNNRWCFDQLAWVVNELIHNPDSRRLHVEAWYPPIATQAKLPPCHRGFTFNVEQGRLNLQLQQRSLDVGVGFPFNLAAYSLLMLLICQSTGLTPGYLWHTITDCHVYLNHVRPLDEMFERPTYSAPTVTFDLSKPFLEWQPADWQRISLSGYTCGAPLKLEVAV